MTTATSTQDSVLGKARSILDVFLDGEPGGTTAVLSLTELARRSGVAKASVHRLCGDLVDWGLLEREGTGYRLGLLLFEMGQRAGQRRLRDAALRPMEDLVAECGETVHLAVPSGADVLYVEKLSGHRPVTAPSAVAGRLPLHATATGKVLLAFGPPARLDAVLRAGLRRVTPRTLTHPPLLLAQLDRIRRERIATEVEECRLGHASVAVPVEDGHGVVGALSITGPTSRPDPARHAGRLRRAAGTVGRRLRDA